MTKITASTVGDGGRHGGRVGHDRASAVAAGAARVAAGARAMQRWWRRRRQRLRLIRPGADRRWNVRRMAGTCGTWWRRLLQLRHTIVVRH